VRNFEPLEFRGADNETHLFSLGGRCGIRIPIGQPTIHKLEDTRYNSYYTENILYLCHGYATVGSWFFFNNVINCRRSDGQTYSGWPKWWYPRLKIRFVDFRRGCPQASKKTTEIWKLKHARLLEFKTSKVGNIESRELGCLHNSSNRNSFR
jgi:hypothetical protein